MTPDAGRFRDVLTQELTPGPVVSDTGTESLVIDGLTPQLVVKPSSVDEGLAGLGRGPPSPRGRRALGRGKSNGPGQHSGLV